MSSQWPILTPQSILQGDLTQWVSLAVSIFRWSTSLILVPSLHSITGFWKLFSCTYSTNSFYFLNQNWLLLNTELIDPGLEIIKNRTKQKNHLESFQDCKQRKHALFFWYGITHQKIVLNKTLNFLAQRKQNTTETNKMCHNNLRFTIPFPDLLLPLAIPKAETNKTNPFSISSWNCLGCDKTLRNSFVIMVLHFIGTSPEEVVNGCFQIHRAIKG